MTPQQIAEFIFTGEGIPVEELTSRTRLRKYVTARQISCYLIEVYTGAIQETIATIFGRNRSMIVAYNKKIKGYIEVEKKTREKVENYERLLINRIKEEK
jgi:chromosomal replication initiation ATPase DnaA